MRKILTALLLIISILAFGQDYNFKPNWKKGETKTVIITRVEKEYKSDELESEATITSEASIKVLNEDKEKYVLEILYDNVALTSALEFYDKLGEELTDYKKLRLVYSIDKETAKADLVNWEETQSFMNESFDKITDVLEKMAPEMASYTGMVFTPIKDLFKSKENVEGYVENEIGYILVPFGKNFTIGKTIKTTKTQENPFNPAMEISETTLLTLKSVDTDKKICTINQEIELDLSEFREMIKSMMKKMSQSFGANDSIMESKSKEMDEFEMDMTNLQVITFDYKASWVTKVVTTATVVATEPGKGKKKTEVIATVIIK